jgi:hypothetical protein
MNDVDNSVGEIVRTGVQSKKNSITILKRALNKHTKPAIDLIASIMNDTSESKKTRMIAAQELLKLHMESIKVESTEKARNKEFAAKHHELLVSIQRNGGVIVDDFDDDENSDSPILDFENIAEVD